MKEQWQCTVQSLNKKLDLCNNLIKELRTFEEQYSTDLAFIEQGESLINEHTNQPCENGSLSLRDQKSKCQVIYSS